jgi:hypothetical protein
VPGGAKMAIISLARPLSLLDPSRSPAACVDLLAGHGGSQWRVITVGEALGYGRQGSAALGRVSSVARQIGFLRAPAIGTLRDGYTGGCGWALKEAARLSEGRGALFATAPALAGAGRHCVLRGACAGGVVLVWRKVGAAESSWWQRPRDGGRIRPLVAHLPLLLIIHDFFILIQYTLFLWFRLPDGTQILPEVY